MNSLQFAEQKCAGCGGKVFRLETRGFIGRDRLAPSHFILLNPLPFTVCVECGMLFNPMKVEDAMPEEGNGAAGPSPIVPP